MGGSESLRRFTQKRSKINIRYNLIDKVIWSKILKDVRKNPAASIQPPQAVERGVAPGPPRPGFWKMCRFFPSTRKCIFKYICHPK